MSMEARHPSERALVRGAYDLHIHKEQAMAAMAAQGYLRRYYHERAEQRANHARRISGDQRIRYAEAFMYALPQMVGQL
jgi:4-oxalomesaconate hydratase